LFDDPATQLPTFNSLAIESVLHRIHNLSEHFLYFNNGTHLFRVRACGDFFGMSVPKVPARVHVGGCAHGMAFGPAFASDRGMRMHGWRMVGWMDG
jgi:hypothetical protein